MSELGPKSETAGGEAVESKRIKAFQLFFLALRTKDLNRETNIMTNVNRDINLVPVVNINVNYHR